MLLLEISSILEIVSGQVLSYHGGRRKQSTTILRERFKQRDNCVTRLNQSDLSEVIMNSH